MVPAFEVLDAVGSGVAEIGHTASFYWQGKIPATAFFTTVPFGLTPNEHVAWVEAGGGQALWDELYAPFGVKPFMGGNTGVCMGGWFRREIKSRDDMRGLKIRSLGLGGEVFRRLGATPQTTPPAEILTSLQSGVIDAAEFVGPGTDIALGLYRVAPFYYGPGFNKPNGTGECIVALKAWNSLDADLKAIVAHACATEANFALAEMERLNTEALAALTTQHRVQLRAFPADLIGSARPEAARRACRSRRTSAQRRSPRLLYGVPRAHRRLVAGFDQGRAGRARRLDKAAATVSAVYLESRAAAGAFLTANTRRCTVYRSLTMFGAGVDEGDSAVSAGQRHVRDARVSSAEIWLSVTSWDRCGARVRKARFPQTRCDRNATPEGRRTNDFQVLETRYRDVRAARHFVRRQRGRHAGQGQILQRPAALGGHPTTTGSGFYVGINGGYSWSEIEVTRCQPAVVHTSPNGGLFGRHSRVQLQTGASLSASKRLDLLDLEGTDSMQPSAAHPAGSRRPG